MGRAEDVFDKYLLSEYENIAQAHFKSTETISAFFRYYLLIMSLPLSAFAILAQQFFDVAKSEQIRSFLGTNRLLFSLVLFLVSVIGVGLFWYVVNLRFDAVLYARTVNGIRKRYFDKDDEDFNLKLRTRVLPQSPLVPPYHEKIMFWPVILVFGILNSIYFFLGLCLFLIPSFLFQSLQPVVAPNPFMKALATALAHLQIVIPTALFFLLHFLFYYWLAMHREKSYLKSSIIGIDIDGVMNEHRRHFCVLLKKNVGKEIDPSNILVIPVHEDARLGIEASDEVMVFNDPNYWKDMPKIKEDISKILRELKRAFRFKVLIFTHRGWPYAPSPEERESLNKGFQNSCTSVSTFFKFRMWVGRKSGLKFLPIKQLTKEWLNRNGILFDKLYMETGNEYITTIRGRYHNRFWISRKKNIRYFVEDDLEKAIKLSYICDVVFLISQPYNVPSMELPPALNQLRANLPNNIIRVKNWQEIQRMIRRFA